MWAFFVGEARYHVPLLPVFSILAAIGLAAIEPVSGLRSASPRSTPAPLALP
jgi:hypothetical protein